MSVILERATRREESAEATLSRQGSKDGPNSCAKAIHERQRESFTNIYVLLQFGLYKPRNVTRLRANMAQEVRMRTQPHLDITPSGY